jgi:signal transduction histidine kinase
MGTLPDNGNELTDLSEGQEKLDLISVLKVSQALPQEIVLDKLIGNLMSNVLIHAGAQRGLLLFIEQTTAVVAASGHVEDNKDVAIDLVRPQGRKGACYEIRITTPGGQEKRLETMGQLDGDTYIGAVIDLTNLRATEAELRSARVELARASQATTLGELTASIAHEINQPLASIVSNASAGIRWLDRSLPELAETRESLQEIAKEGKRAGVIVYALRSLTKQATPDFQLLNIDDVIATVLRLTSSEIEHRQVVLKRRLSTRSALISGDRVLLQQVVFNLVNNALEAMVDNRYDARQLTVWSHAIGKDSVVVSIEDTGIGIPDASRHELFDAFFTTKGSGMGLAICRSVIYTHGGNIHAFAGRKGAAYLSLRCLLLKPECPG